jgi:anti-anti-sigma factor
MSASPTGDVERRAATPDPRSAGTGPLPRLLDSLGLVLWEADARTREFTVVSGHVEGLLGFPASRWFDDPAALSSVIHRDDRDEVLRNRWPGAAEQDDYELTYRVTAADGRVVWVNERIHVVRDSDGAALRLQGVLSNATERKTAEERERFLTTLELALQPLEDAEEIMTVAARLLGEYIGADRCAYAQAEADEDHFVMSGDHHTGLPPLPGRFKMSEFGDGCMRAMRAGEPWVVADSRHDPRLAQADLAAYEFTGIRAVICVPLHKAGRFVAAMAVHQATVRHWLPAEIHLVEVVVNRCWESLERTHASWALRESENRYRLLVQRATDGIWITDRDMRFVEVNAAACELLGHSRAELLGRNFADLVPAEHESRLRELLAGPATAQVITDVWETHRADGTAFALELSIQTTPTGLQAIGRDVTARQRAEAERDLLLQREHEIADALQRSLLPRELPALAQLAASARYLPASAHAQAGGDWYEVLPVIGTVVALSVGDVVGKGPTAAAVMGQLRSALAGYLLDGHSPAAALERLDAFAKRTHGASGSTCACLTFDWGTGRLCWALAGHPPPLILNAGKPRFLSTATGAVLGMPDRVPYTEDTTVIPPGASVVLYTDGLVERRDVLIDNGLHQLLDVAHEARDQEPDALTNTITDALLSEGHHDDVALVVVRYMPQPLHRRVPAVPAEVTALRRQVSEWASVAGLPLSLQDDLQLALSEAAANAVEHAYPQGPGEFEYTVSRTADGGLDVRVRDWGQWRPVPADNGFRGRGLGIIRALAEEATFDHTDVGTTVTFHLAAAQGVPPSLPTASVENAVPAGLTVDDSDASVQVLRLTGDLDITTVDSLRGGLLARIDVPDRRPVDIDLTALGYLSSSGIALLLEATTMAIRRARAITVTAADGTPPARILALSGLQGSSTNAGLTVRSLQAR